MPRLILQFIAPILNLALALKIKSVYQVKYVGLVFTVYWHLQHQNEMWTAESPWSGLVKDLGPLLF